MLVQEKLTKEKDAPKTCPNGYPALLARKAGWQTALPCAGCQRAAVLAAPLRACAFLAAMLGCVYGVPGWGRNGGWIVAGERGVSPSLDSALTCLWIGRLWGGIREWRV